MSIEDVNPEQEYEHSLKGLINSPRTLEACKRQGIELNELDPVSWENVKEMLAEREKKKNIPKELIQIRLEFYEKKRRQKIDLIKEVNIEINCLGKVNDYRGTRERQQVHEWFCH